MADLPREGCTEVAPFTYCGADMFGPLIIKERRLELSIMMLSSHVFPVVLCTMK